jgi:hypothetical protein
LATKGASPAAELRKLMSASFSLDEIKALCFDLGVDYDSLGGDDKNSKIIELIQHNARNKRVSGLIDACRKARPDVNWSALSEAAAQAPEAFGFVPVSVDARAPLLNMSPDRALKLGFAAGVLVLALVGCGFSGGLLASNLISVTISPVQPDQRVLQTLPIVVGGQTVTVQSSGARTFEQMAKATTVLSPGTPVQMSLNNVAATTLVDNAVKQWAGAPISDPHVRFNADGTGTFNCVLGGRRIVVGFTATADGKRIIVTPVQAVAQIVDTGSTFGWVAAPVSIAQPAIDFAQRQLDALTRDVWFSKAEIGEDKLTLEYAPR